MFNMEDQLIYTRLGLLWTTITAFLMILLSVACLCRRFRRRPPIRPLDSLSETDPLLGATRSVSSNEGRITQSDHPVLTEILTSANLREVMGKVWEARPSWRGLGIQLGLAIDKLDVVERDYPNNTDRCFQEMLRLWLDKGDATWSSMISALKHPSIGMDGLATSIATSISESRSGTAMHRLPLSVMLETPVRNDLDSDGDSSDQEDQFPFVDFEKLSNNDEVQLRSRLHSEAKQTKKEFAYLLVKTQQSLKGYNVPPQDVASTVWTFAGCDESTQPLRTTLNVDDVGSIDKLFRQLEEDNYLSFINFHIVEALINCHGSGEDKTRLQSYKESFKKYCRRSVFEVPKNAFGSVQGDHEKLVCKVTKEVIQCMSPHCACESDDDLDTIESVKVSSQNLGISLGDSLSIQEKIAETLNMNPATLILAGASKGCVELTFSVPKAVMEKTIAQFEKVEGAEESLASRFAKLDAQGIHLKCGLLHTEHGLADEHFKAAMDNVLCEAMEKWYEIGLQLGLSENSLDRIKRDCKGSRRSLRMMFATWLRQRGATWEQLIKALQSRDEDSHLL